MTTSTGPLSHVRVLDLSRILAAPWAGQILADLGAEVIKVERPGAGDDTRSWGPPFLKDAEGKDTREAGYYLAVNRGKRSITLSIDKPEGQRVVRELAMRADIVLENYKAGTLERYGLDEASLRKLNPKLIYCSVTGFGQTGPRRDQPAYDFLIQAMGGAGAVEQMLHELHFGNDGAILVGDRVDADVFDEWRGGVVRHADAIGRPRARMPART